MTTFAEFRQIVKLSSGDKTSRKRMGEIRRALHETGVLRKPTPEKAVACIEKLGPTFVKVGQIASNRADLVPKEYCEAFSKLRANVQPMTFEEIEKCLEWSYGHPWQEDFAELDPKPLGSASVAQVHKAKLHDGTVVAVKVQRPYIKYTMAADIQLMRRVLATADFLTPSSTIIQTAYSLVGELETITHDELDFAVELNNLMRFYNFTKDIDGISSPMPYPQYSTKYVLVMDFVEGHSVLDFDKAAEHGHDLAVMGERIADNYVTQVIDEGFFHADPHPGNMVVRPSGEVTWIDLGMTGRLSPNQRATVGRIFTAIAGNNVYDLKDALLALATPRGEINHGELLQQVEMLLARYGSVSMEDLNVGEAMVDLVDLLQRYNLALPSALTSLARGFLTLEGVVSEIAPQASLVAIISKHVEAQITDLSGAKEKAKEMIASTIASAEATAKLPTQMGNTLEMLQKGQLSVGMTTNIPDKLLGDIYSMVGRLSLALIAAALYVGSAMLCTTELQPAVLEVPALGIAGFIGAFVLSIYVIFSTIKTRHQIRNDLDIK